jgi:hypothetical protein
LFLDNGDFFRFFFVKAPTDRLGSSVLFRNLPDPRLIERSRMTSSVSSGKSFGAEEADGFCLPSPCEEDGAQPNEQVNNKVIPRNDEIKNVARGTLRTCRINPIDCIKNSSVRISFGLFTCIANLHAADMQN